MKIIKDLLSQEEVWWNKLSEIQKAPYNRLIRDTAQKTLRLHFFYINRQYKYIIT